MFDKFFSEKNTVNHPSHYTGHPSNIETIEIARELPFDLGNAWKYLMRFRFKGKPVEDLQKAVWYLDDYIAQMYQKEGEKLKSIRHQMSANNLYFDDDLKHNEITAKMLQVIEAENDEYVRAALEMIATIAVYGNAQFINVNNVMTQLQEHIPEVAKTEQFDKICDEANEILEDLAKDDESQRRFAEEMARQRKRNEEKASMKGKVGPQTDEGLREMITKLKDVNDPIAEIPEFEHRETLNCGASLKLDTTVDNERLIGVLVNNRNEVIPQTVELNPNEQYRTELVEVPVDVLAQGHDAAVAFAEKLITDKYGVKIVEEGTEDVPVMDAH